MAKVRARIAASARGLALATGVIIISSISIGWLYWLRPTLAIVPGPRVSDALPLDELPGHAGVSLLLFVLVFAAAGLVHGCLARVLRIDRLTAAIFTWFGTAAFLYLASAVSIFVVRQVSFDLALDSSRNLEGVYLAATLSALGGATLAANPTKGRATETVAAIAVAIFAAADLLTSILPPRSLQHGIIGLISHASGAPLERTFGIIAGLLLLIASRALARRSRPGWMMTVALLLSTVILRLVAGFNNALTLLAILLLLFLLAWRHSFTSRADPSQRPSALGRLLGMLIAAFVFGMTALIVNSLLSNLPVRLAPALRTTLFAFVAMTPHRARFISGDFGEWFPWSVLAIAATGAVWAAGTYLAPWRARLYHDLPRWQLAQAIVRASGADSLAPFVLRADKSLFIYPDGVDDSDGTAAVLIGYRVVRGVAIVSGDPIGPLELLPDALRAFLALLDDRGWRLGIVGASERCLPIYHHLGLRALYHGDEAVIDTATFSLGGGALKTVRQASNRIERKGYSATLQLAGEIDEPTRDELRSLESSWLRFRPAKGFVMELDELFRLDGDDALFVTARAADGSITGFLEFAVCHAIGSLSLSSMPRRGDAPNGLNAFLVVEAIRWAQAHEYGSLSLNFSPFARLLTTTDLSKRSERVARKVLVGLKALLSLQLDNLYMFNQRFAPQWQPRFVIYRHRRHLLRIAVAAMAAERYLPFTDWLRGRDWKPRLERDSPERPQEKKRPRDVVTTSASHQ